MTTAVLLRLLGVRHLRHHLLRTLLTLLGVTGGISLLSAVQRVNGGLSQAFDGFIQRVTGGADLVVTGSAGGIPDSLLEEVIDVPGVAHAAPWVERQVNVPAFGERLLLLGVDLLGDRHFLSLDGTDSEDSKTLDDPLAFMNSTDGILLSSSYAQKHGLKRGDTFTIISLTGKREVRILGLLEAKGPVVALGGAVAIAPIDSLQALLGWEHRYSRISIAAAIGVDVDKVSDALTKKMGSRAMVQRPGEMGAMGDKVLGSFRRGLRMTTFIALLVAATLVYNTMLISVAQRRREMGILRALGAIRWTTFALVLVEAGVLGALGGLLGTGAGTWLAQQTLEGVAPMLSSFYLPIHPEKIPEDPMSLAIGTLLGFFLAALASIGPARDVFRASPIESLRHGTNAWSQPKPLKAIPRVGVAVALLVVALVVSRIDFDPEEVVTFAAFAAAGMFAGLLLLTPVGISFFHFLTRNPAWRRLGVSAGLAIDHAQRTIQRGVANVSGLAAAVLSVVAVAGYLDSFGDSLRTWTNQVLAGEFLVVPASDRPGQEGAYIKTDVLKDISAIPGVTDVLPAFTLNQPFLDGVVRVRAVEMEKVITKNLVHLPDGKPLDAAPYINADAPAVLIDEGLARRNKLRVDDMITLSTPSGAIRFRIGAIVVEYTSPGGVIVMDRKLFIRFYREDVMVGFQVFTSPDANLDALQSRIQKEVDVLDLRVMRNTEYRETISSTIEDFFILNRLLILVTLILSVLGLVNTLQANVLDRIRELGMLRAIGASRWQVASTVVWESVAMALVACLLGVPGGLLVGRWVLTSLMTAQTGWSFPYVFPWLTTLAGIAVTLVAAAIGAWLPARQAANIRITESLAYD